MSVNEKLTEWGIDIPAGVYAPEYLLEYKADNCFFAGRVEIMTKSGNDF